MVKVKLKPLSLKDLSEIASISTPSLGDPHRSDEWPSRELIETAPLLYNDMVHGEREGPFGAWMVVDENLDMIVGDIGLVPSADRDDRLKLGYSILSSQRNKGYGETAVREFMGMIDLEGWTVIAEVVPSNTASRKILGRNGFIHEENQEGMEIWKYEGS